MIILVRALWLAVLLIAPGLTLAAQYVDHLGHRIHYATFSSMIIPPDVAALHNINRAENRIVLNVSIVHETQPATGSVKGWVTNLLNQRYELTFTEVRESDAVYYLASHMALEQDILRFNLEVSPGAAEDPVAINFLRRYD